MIVYDRNSLMKLCEFTDQVQYRQAFGVAILSYPVGGHYRS